LGGGGGGGVILGSRSQSTFDAFRRSKTWLFVLLSPFSASMFACYVFSLQPCLLDHMFISMLDFDSYLAS
jgi:hypothetical protein